MIVKMGLESRPRVVEGYVTIVNRVSYRVLWMDVSQLLTGSLKAHPVLWMDMPQLLTGSLKHTQCCEYMSQLLTGSLKLKAHPVLWIHIMSQLLTVLWMDR